MLGLNRFCSVYQMSERIEIMKEAERLYRFRLAWLAKITTTSARVLAVADKGAAEKDKSKSEYIYNVQMPKAARGRALAISGEKIVRKIAGERYQEHPGIYQEEALREAKEAEYRIFGWGDEETQADQ